MKIGPYRFGIHWPQNNAESAELDNWFRDHEPVPVTKAMMERHIGHIKPELTPIETIGHGSYGTVMKCMEKRCGLLVAIKEQTFEELWLKQVVSQEISFMKHLSHVSNSHLCHTYTF